MSDDVVALYHGPSGCLIADGFELLRDVETVIPREIAERVAAHLPDHELEILGDAPKASTEVAASKADAPSKGRQSKPEAVTGSEVRDPLSEGDPQTSE